MLWSIDDIMVIIRKKENLPLVNKKAAGTDIERDCFSHDLKHSEDMYSSDVCPASRKVTVTCQWGSLP